MEPSARQIIERLGAAARRPVRAGDEASVVVGIQTTSLPAVVTQRAERLEGSAAPAVFIYMY